MKFWICSDCSVSKASQIQKGKSQKWMSAVEYIVEEKDGQSSYVSPIVQVLGDFELIALKNTTELIAHHQYGNECFDFS